MKLSSKRTLLVLAAGIVIATTVLAARPLLKRRFLAPAVAAGHSPSPAAMDAFLSTYTDPATPLEILWQTAGVNQRDYVIDYLHRNVPPTSETWQKFRPSILSSVALPDQELRQNVMILLEKNRDPQIPTLALPLLHDPDPEARMTALHAFTAINDSRYLPVVGPLLEDPEPAVRVVAAAAIYKLAQSEIPRDADVTIEQSATKWWNAHKSTLIPITETAVQSTTYPLAPELHCIDTDGNPVDLTKLRGKTILLNFWATWCGPCLEELPTLQAVAAQHPEEVVVIGIAIDAAPDDDGDAPQTTPAQAADKIATLRKQNNLTYRIALDNDGRAMNAYGGESLPTSILIDKSGHLRRRLLGARSLNAWNDMLAELKN